MALLPVREVLPGRAQAEDERRSFRSYGCVLLWSLASKATCSRADRWVDSVQHGGIEDPATLGTARLGKPIQQIPAL